MKFLSLPLATVCDLLLAQNCSPVVACDADALICPDGSTVGRVEPKCEFAKCPAGTGSGSGNQDVGCDADAKICPDGTYVGRAGPKCEFTACGSNNTTGDNGMKAPEEAKTPVPSATAKSSASAVVASVSVGVAAIVAVVHL